MRNKIAKWICKIFNHKFDLIDVTMFKIELSALNTDQLNPKITCKRCGKTWTREGGEEND